MRGRRTAPKSKQEHFAHSRASYNSKSGRYEARVGFYDSDAEPVHSFAHVDDIIVVRTTSRHEKL
jgi:hypothetical protein